MAGSWRFRLSWILLACAAAQIVQGLNPNEGEAFYAKVQAEIESEVKVAKDNLVKQARVAEVATKNYAAAKVKQNFFKALRVLAEKELEQISMQNRLRQPRQAVEDEEEATDDNEATTARTVPLIPVVANVLKAVFGGNNQTGVGGVNLTYHLQSVSSLINTRINGLTNLLSNPFRRTTQAPVHIIQVLPIPVAKANSTINDPVITKLFQRENVREDQGLSNDMPAIDYFVSNTTDTPSTSSSPPRVIVVNQTSETGTPAPGVIYIDALTKDVQEGLDGLIKAMPDLFKGAREAIQLITSLREFLED